MNRSKLVALVGLIALFFVAGMACAQGAGPHSGCQQRFDSMDTDHDGKLTKTEFMAAPHHRGDAEQMFNAMDASKQGFLTKDQFCSGKGMGRGGMGQGMGRGMGQGSGQGQNMGTTQ